MSGRLLPCPACARHVRIIESFCPFCGNTLPLAYQSAGPAVLPKRRLGRAALAAFGAAAIMSGCGGDDTSATDSSITVDSSADSTMADSSTPDATADTGIAPAYGAPVDAGPDAMADATADTSVAPAYGAAADAGPPDATTDGAPAAMYGAPP